MAKKEKIELTPEEKAAKKSDTLTVGFVFGQS